MVSPYIAEIFDRLYRPAPLAYCDYIADRISRALRGADQIIDRVSSIKSDLHPIEGWLVSTKKTIEVIDRFGKVYRVTVEEAAP